MLCVCHSRRAVRRRDKSEGGQIWRECQGDLTFSCRGQADSGNQGWKLRGCQRGRTVARIHVFLGAVEVYSSVVIFRLASVALAVAQPGLGRCVVSTIQDLFIVPGVCVVAVCE